MSMNLTFITTQGNHFVEFPYQTTTDITKAVLKATTKEKQLAILKDDLWLFVNDKDNPEQVEFWAETCKDIKMMLYNPTLRLTEI